MIVDAFMWSYERDAVELRLETLRSVVDIHVAVQATNDFRGNPREVQSLDTDFTNVHDIVVTIPDGLSPWESEKWLRDRVLIEAAKLSPIDSWYIISDGDEIPNPDAITYAVDNDEPMKLMTDYRNFYADWRAVDHVLQHQPTIAKLPQYREVGGANDARWYCPWESSTIIGWHLSSLGDTSTQKLKTFAHTEYDKPKYHRKVNVAKDKHRDFLNRFDLEYTEDVPPHTPAHLLGGQI